VSEWRVANGFVSSDLALPQSYRSLIAVHRLPFAIRYLLPPRPADLATSRFAERMGSAETLPSSHLA
jgi:hypothetical protein